MAAGYVPTSPLNTLYSNTTAGTAASPDAVDGAVQAIVQTLNDNYDAAVTINTGLSTHKNAAVLDHPDQSVTTAKIKDANVTTAKIADAAVTTAKLADVGVTRAKIAIGAVGASQLDATLITGVATQSEFTQRGINVKWYGAVGDGVADDTAEIQAAIDACSASGGGVVHIPQGTYKITASITVPSNITIRGAGMGVTFFVFPTAAAFHYFRATAKTNIRLCDFSITGGGKAASGSYFGIFLDTCTKSLVERVYVYEAEAVGVYFVDCDYCAVKDSNFEYSAAHYAAGDVGYAVEFDGCGYCHMIGCSAYHVSFGFLSIGNDGTGGNSHLSVRAGSYAIGCQMTDCYVNYHLGHAFDLNAVYGNTVSSCVSDHYEGSELSRPAFQNKHDTTDESRNNIFIGCVARNCGSGFFSQEGSNVIFNACQVKNSAYHGMWLNSATQCQIISCIVDGYYGDGVRLENSSSSNLINDITLIATDNVATRGIVFLGSGSNTLDKVTYRNNHYRAMYIDATSNNNVIGRGVRNNQRTIEDLSSQTIYPVSYQIELDLVAATTIKPFGFPQRGMWVMRARIITAVAITGTNPTVNVGDSSSSTTFVNGATADTALAGIVTPTLGSNILNTNRFLRCSTAGGATAGRVFISVEGLELM